MALQVEQVAPDNCVRVSKAFQDLVGDAERGWEEATSIEMDLALTGSATNALLQRASTQSATSSLVSIETFTLEPPPPAIAGGSGASVTSFPSLAPFSGTDFLSTSDHHGGLCVQLEESFVSGEFDVD